LPPPLIIIGAKEDFAGAKEGKTGFSERRKERAVEEDEAGIIERAPFSLSV